MGMKSGLIVGFAGGYVLGSKAGRNRYEQIRRLWGRMMGSSAVQQATGRARELAQGQTKRALYAVQSGVEKAGSAVKDRLTGATDPTAEVREALAANSGTGVDTTPPSASEAMLP